MRSRFWYTPVLLGALALAAACSKHPSTPASPSSAAPANSNANADGSTLKATSPTLQSPVKGVKLDPGSQVTLTVGNASMKFVQNATLSYRFEVYDGGTRVYQSPLVAGGSSGTTSHTVTATLEGDKTYQWQARVEFNGANGPWAARESFVAPVNDGYISGSELYDPLINGKTIGEIHGPVQFIPGVGAQLLTWDSYISYQLPQTLIEGEYSLLVTNMKANTKGDKQKVMAMAQGYDDIIENDRRMTVEKRGDPPGAIAWRLLTHDDRIETSVRPTYNFVADQSYFYQVTWRSNIFNVLIQEGGNGGKTVYNDGHSWFGRPYDPNPHVVYVGAPTGRSGSSAASIENTIYRQIWVSARPRPGFANK